jgi:dihydrofolate synthase/folylpolyglutamate synthase
MSAMRDKDLTNMIPPLQGRVSSAIATETGSNRSLPADDLAESLRQGLDVPVEVISQPGAALARARELAGERGAVLVTGSLYLVGAIRSLLTSGATPRRNER